MRATPSLVGHMNTILGWTALAGFLLSLGAHAFSLFGVDVQSRVPMVWLLHVGIFLVFIPMVFQLRSVASGGSVRALLRGIPVWPALLVVLLFAYALVNFFVAFGGSGQGAPTVRGNGFVLERKGVVIRQITEAEYRSLRAAEIRGFSGHWLVFYFVPFTHFLLRRRESAYA